MAAGKWTSRLGPPHDVAISELRARLLSDFVSFRRSRRLSDPSHVTFQQADAEGVLFSDGMLNLRQILVVVVIHVDHTVTRPCGYPRRHLHRFARRFILLAGIPTKGSGRRCGERRRSLRSGMMLSVLSDSSSLALND